MVIYHPFAGNWSVEKLEQFFGESIHKKFPNIRPKFLVGGPPGTAIPELIMAKQAIDIVFVSIGATQTQFLDFNLGYDISPFIQKSRVDLGKFDENSIRQLKELGKGALYGLPLFDSIAATVYNKDLFDKFGVAYPRDGITWDELYELNKKLTVHNGNVQYYGFSAATRDTIGMNQRSAQLFRPGTDEVLVTTDVWKNLIHDLVRFYAVPGYDTSPAASNAANQQKRFFDERTTAMYIGSSGLPFQRLAGMNFDFATYPVYPETPKAGPAPYPTNIYVTSISKHKEQAFQVLDYLTSKEFQSFAVQDGTQVSVLDDADVKRAFGTKSQMLQGKNVSAFLALQHSPPLASNSYTTIATGAVQDAIVAVVAGEKDVNTALRQAEEAANKTIAERKGK
ncbi:extracellular solute-binding protein [Paenibacillus ginsengarvi]|nr:extracellular solute-binding protein [Paenibacillus ginsengarvi]